MVESFKRLKASTKAVLAVVAIAVAAMAGFGIYGLIKGPPAPAQAAPLQPATQAPIPASTAAPEPSDGGTVAPEPPPESDAETGHDHGDMHGGEGLAPPEEAAGETLPDIEASNDPIVYTKNLTRAMFEFKTTDGLVPLDYIQRIMRDADPSGDEAAGLRQDLERWLSSEESWRELQRYKTIQTIEIEKVYIPAEWADALAQDTANRIKPGTTAVTVTAIVHRTGIVDGKNDEWSQRFSFTAFITCAPTYPTCHPMRLSYMNEVLR